jgi:hypothetical protein
LSDPAASLRSTLARFGIWGAAAGYFLAYVPYSALAKALSGGHLPGAEGGVSGLELLPSTVMASTVGMFAFLTAMRWWRFATQRQVGGVSLPSPTVWTLLSGLCTAAIIATTTMAYTFRGVSIVFMMLLMRGGVLALAPVVDLLSGRTIRWFSAAALGFSLSALVAAFYGGDTTLSALAIADIVAYLAAYFFRLQAMSRMAKTDDPDVTRRYFVEEQMVATPAVLLVLAVGAALGVGEIGEALRAGFTTFFDRGAAYVLPALLIGLFSQGTGIFGGFVLLGRQENSFCVPVNRASSILAGLVASAVLALTLGLKPPGTNQIVGAVLVLTAILFLSLPPLLSARRAAAAAG